MAWREAAGGSGVGTCFAMSMRIYLFSFERNFCASILRIVYGVGIRVIYVYWVGVLGYWELGMGHRNKTEQFAWQIIDGLICSLKCYTHTHTHTYQLSCDKCVFIYTGSREYSRKIARRASLCPFPRVPSVPCYVYNPPPMSINSLKCGITKFVQMSISGVSQPRGKLRHARRINTSIRQLSWRK